VTVRLVWSKGLTGNKGAYGSLSAQNLRLF
jgi:hypothetical protein